MQNLSCLYQATEKDLGERRNKKIKQMASSQGDKQNKCQGKIEALEVKNSCQADKKELS